MSSKLLVARPSAAMLKAMLLTSSMMTIAPSVLAQDEPRGGIDVITVTSQKRAENIQDVPISVIAIGTEKLEQLEVTSFDDYAKFLPSVTFQSTGPDRTNVYFRGVVSGGDGNHSASLPSVGVYLDEQPVTTILGFLPIHIYDIERVEAIAGPQGTLFGASAQSGVLRIITNKPDPSGFEAGIDLEGNTITHGDVGYQFEGFTNVPISDNAAIRLVAYYNKEGGYIDNIFDTRDFPTSGVHKDNAALVENDFNDAETFGARAALRIDLSDSWTVTPTLLGQKTRTQGIFAFDPDLGDLNVSRFEPDFQTDKFYQAALTVEGKIGNFDLVYAGAYLKRQIDSSFDYTDYAYYYDVNSGYGVYFYGDGGPMDYVDPTQFYQGDDSFAKFSNEIRLSTPQDKRFRMVVGLFQNHQRHFIHQQYIVRDLAAALQVTDHDDTVWLTEQKRTDRDYAVFGELEFDLTDNLTLIGGVRGYKYKNALQGFFGYGSGFATNFGTTTGELSCFPSTLDIPGAPCINLDKTVEDTGETHKAGLKWDVSDNKMLYFTYATGFRPGGINRRGTLPPYLADELISYEAGWKTEWGSRFIFNAAFFWQKWNDFQFPILGQNGLTEIKNANQARIIGVEADAQWMPTDRLTFTGAVSLIDAQLTANYCGYVNAAGEPETNCPFPVDDPMTDQDETAPPEAPDGQQLPVVPGFKGTFTARYEFPLGVVDAHLQASVSGQTESQSELLSVDRAILGSQPGFVVADFSAGVARDNWEIVAYIANAFDERADLYNFVACPIGTCGERAYQGTNQPRTIGIRFSSRFGKRED